VNSRGEIFVFDGKVRRIIRITADGKFSGYIDPQRSPSYAPIRFDIDKDDNIYILDIFSKQVIVLSTRGEYRKHIKFPGKYGAFTDLTVDYTGNVLLLDGANARVFSTAGHSGSFADFLPV
jgi:sugar lactone lactonase YvrE